MQIQIRQYHLTVTDRQAGVGFVQYSARKTMMITCYYEFLNHCLIFCSGYNQTKMCPFRTHKPGKPPDDRSAH